MLPVIERLRAVFITTTTNNVDTLVGGWDCFAEQRARQIVFNHLGARFDPDIMARLHRHAPDVVFYIGALHGPGIPDIRTLHAINDKYPLIHVCCDGGDPAWWPQLELYGRHQCFRRQINIDGCEAPVDVVTLAPIDIRPFDMMPAPVRDLRCGWAGNLGSEHRRKIVSTLRCEVRERRASGYDGYVSFLRRCRVALNISRSGNPTVEHVKARVIEAAFAGCALLEHEQAPTPEWIPEIYYLRYRDAAHAAQLLRETGPHEITARARGLARYVRRHYHPRMIYAEMLEGLI